MAEDLRLGVGIENDPALRALHELTKETQRFSNKSAKAFSKLNVAVGSFAGILASRAVTAGLQAVSAGFAQASRDARDFSKGVGEINTLLPANAKLTKQAEAALVGFTSQFGSDIADQSRAFYQIVSAGITDVGGALNFLEQSSKAAVAGLATVEQAADLVTSQFNVFGKTGETAQTIFDKVFETVRLGKTTFGELAQNLGQVSPFAAAAGASFDEVAGTLAFLTKNGIKTDLAVRGLRQVFASVIKPSDEAKKTAKALGIEFNTTAIRGGKFADFLKDVAIRTKRNEGALAKLFGNVRALNPILAIVNGNFKDFKQILDEVRNTTGGTERAFAVMEGTFDFQIKRMVQNFQRIGLTISKVFLPGLTKVIRQFNTFLDAFDVSKAVKSLAGFGIAVIDFLVRPIEKVISLYNNIDGVFTAVLAKATQAAINGVGDMVAGIATLLNKLNPFANMFDVSGIKKEQDQLNKVFNGVVQESTKDLGTPISNSLKVAMMDAAKNAAPVAAAAGKVIKQQFNQGVLSEQNNDPMFVDNQLLMAEISEMQQSLGFWEQLVAGTMGRTFSTNLEQQKNFLAGLKSFSQKSSKLMRQGFAGGIADGFSAFGAALVDGENALAAFGKAFAKAIGQAAVQLGTRFILEGIAISFNPFMGGPAVGGPLIAAGAALATFGGALGALVGGGDKGGAGGGVTGSDLAPDLNDSFAEAPTVAEQKATSINVNVEGNVVDQDEFFVRMADGLRDAIQKDGAILEVRSA